MVSVLISGIKMECCLCLPLALMDFAVVLGDFRH